MWMQFRYRYVYFKVSQTIYLFELCVFAVSVLLALFTKKRMGDPETRVQAHCLRSDE